MVVAPVTERENLYMYIYMYITKYCPVWAKNQSHHYTYRGHLNTYSALKKRILYDTINFAVIFGTLHSLSCFRWTRIHTTALLKSYNVEYAQSFSFCFIKSILFVKRHYVTRSAKGLPIIFD